MFDGDPGDDDDPDMEAAQEAQQEALRDAAFDLQRRWDQDDLDGVFRRLGLHVQQHQPMPTAVVVQADMPLPPMCMVVSAHIGDMAWTQRVLDPDDAAFDRQFDTIEHEAAKDRFLDIRAELQDRINRGLDPFGDDE